jgi:hypothetical protein
LDKTREIGFSKEEPLSPQREGMANIEKAIQLPSKNA